MKDEKTHIKITKRRICCLCSSRLLLRRRIEKQRSSYEKSCQTRLQTLLRPTSEPGGGRKITTPQVIEALYDWFIGVSLKARLLPSLIKAQAKFFYDNWWQSEEVK